MKSLIHNRRAEGSLLAIGAIIAVIIATAFALLVGSIILSKTYDVAGNMGLSPDANSTVEGMFDIKPDG
jgi:hypothetical protein